MQLYPRAQTEHMSVVLHHTWLLRETLHQGVKELQLGLTVVPLLGHVDSPDIWWREEFYVI